MRSLLSKTLLVLYQNQLKKSLMDKNEVQVLERDQSFFISYLCYMEQHHVITKNRLKPLM